MGCLVLDLLGFPITTLFLWVKYSLLDKCLFCHGPPYDTVTKAHGGKEEGQLVRHPQR